VGPTLQEVVTRFCSRSCQFRHDSGLDTLAVTTRFRLGSGFDSVAVSTRFQLRLGSGFNSVPISTRLRLRLHGRSRFLQVPVKIVIDGQGCAEKPICLLLSGTKKCKNHHHYGTGPIPRGRAGGAAVPLRPKVGRSIPESYKFGLGRSESWRRAAPIRLGHDRGRVT
jgi:hypothetical protein